VITPQKVTLLIGQSTTFRLVDTTGQKERNVIWNVSEPGAFQISEGDELTITAKEPGDFRVTGRSGSDAAEASVKVMEGESMPVGTVKWSAGSIDGCKTIKIIPAFPSPSGPDVYEQSQCADGPYVAAYTEGGILLWRRKMDGLTTIVPAHGTPNRFIARPVISTPVSSRTQSNKNADPATPAAHLDTHSGSICDAINAGDQQNEIRDQLRDRNLPIG
jgi:hypothetical protein